MRREQLQRRAVARIASMQLSAAFGAWRDDTERKLRLRGIADKVVQRLKHRRLGVALEAWKASQREARWADATAHYERTT